MAVLIKYLSNINQTNHGFGSFILAPKGTGRYESRIRSGACETLFHIMCIPAVVNKAHTVV